MDPLTKNQDSHSTNKSPLPIAQILALHQSNTVLSKSSHKLIVLHATPRNSILPMHIGHPSLSHAVLPISL